MSTGQATRGTAALQGALVSPDRHVLCHAVELGFGGRVAAHPTSIPTRPWTLINWQFTFQAIQNLVSVYVSLDDGASWQQCPKNGPIPGIEIGDIVAGLQLRVRQVFRGPADSGPVLHSLHIEIHFEPSGDGPGETFTYDEPGDSPLSAGTFSGTRYDPVRNAVVIARDNPVLTFLPSGSGSQRRAIVPAGNGTLGSEIVTFNAGTDVSNGKPIWFPFVLDPLSQPHNVTLLVPDHTNPNWRSQLGFTLEMWIRPNLLSGRRVIAAWLHTRRHVTFTGVGGTPCFTRLELDDDRLRFTAEELVILHSLPTAPVYAHNRHIQSAPGLMKLNEWQHVAVRYTGTDLEIWLDGRIVVGAAWHANAATGEGWALADRPHNYQEYGFVMRTDGPLMFGTALGNNDHFVGQISEIRLWRVPVQPQQRWQRRLHQAEAAALVASPLHQLEGYWTFDDYVFAPNDLLIADHGRGTNTMRGVAAVAPATVADYWSRRMTINGEAVALRESPPIPLVTEDGVLRLTTAPMNLTLFGKTFFGVGALGTLSALQESTDLVPRGLELTLNGVDPNLVSVALGTAYQDLPCRAWAVLLDENNLVVQDPLLIFEGEMDQMTVVEDTGDEDMPRVAMIRVTAESHLLDWSRGSGLVWNDQTQLARTPADHGFEFLAETYESQIWWPKQVPDKDAPLKDE